MFVLQPLTQLLVRDHRQILIFALGKFNPAGIYLLKINNGNSRTRCEICSEFTIKTPEQRQLASFWCLYY